MTLTETQIAISLLNGIGLKKATQMIAGLGEIEAIFEENEKTIHEKTNIGLSVIKSMQRKEAIEKAKEINQIVAQKRVR